VTKRERERAIFREFANAAGIGGDVECVESREPPEPDILCTFKSGNRTAYELTEIMDEARKQELSDMSASLNHLHDLVKQLPETHPFRNRFANAQFHIRFNENANINARRNICNALPDYLISEGALLTIRETEYVIPPSGGQIDSIHVRRGALSGPTFTSSAGGALRTPVVDSVAKKYRKPYKTDHEIQLVAYFDTFHSVVPDSWLPGATEFVMVSLAMSPFTRVWVLDVKGPSIQYDSGGAPST